MNHISLGTLAEHLEHRLPAAEERRVAEHLSTGCELCSDEVAWLAKLRRRTETDETPDAPDWLLERALVFFRRLPESVIANDSPSVVASLVFDSSASEPVGVRQAALQSPRALLFRCEGYDVDLQIRKHGPALALRGQVLPTEPGAPPVAGARVELVDLGGLLEATVTDAYGEFAFDDLPAEAFDLRIRPHGGGELYLPGIEPLLDDPEVS